MISKSYRDTATILVASDNISDADLIKTLLDAEFDNVFVSTGPDRAVEDFELRSPNMLVLAFNLLDKSEHYYRNLCKRSEKAASLDHRTIILCDKNAVTQAYQLCRRGRFHDYVLFWPMAYDAPRLLMAAHLALRELTASGASPTAGEFATQARHLNKMEKLLQKHVAQGNQQIGKTRHSARQAEQDIGSALDQFSRQLAQGEPPDSSQSGEGIKQKFERFKREEIEPRLRTVTEAAQPLELWINGFGQECVPQIEAARTLNAMADRLYPAVLIVDDDEFQRTIVGKILETMSYRIEYADGGLAALDVLHTLRPDLVLMDFMMPGIDGIETTRRLKSVPGFASLPVIMMTGRSEENIVIESLQAGAIDFMVKPIERETLIGKVDHVLRTIKINRILAQKKWNDI
ncbi:MAG: response regulator [Nitrosospira sp.]|nr:response regulator [Nitrosospira sp.]